MSKIKVFSEIGNLKKVLVHRPGKEVENLTPDTLERLLFDDVPFLRVAQEEHDAFCDLLRKSGSEVLYIEKLTAEALDQNPDLREGFIDLFIKEANIDKKWLDGYKKYLTGMNNYDMVNEMIAGTQTRDLDPSDKSEYPFITDPLPNVLFQRDPFSSVGHAVALNKMWSVTRSRETIFPDFVFKHHKDWANEVPLVYDRTFKDSIEGGDVLVLNKESLIIGVSQRTTMKAVETLSKKLFAEGSYKKIVVFDLPKTRSFMHLDTVFTNIDYDKFIAHPLIFDNLDAFKIFEVTAAGTKEIKKPLLDVLEELIGKKPMIIRCGGDDPVAAGREQWNDGTNVITVEPGVVIAYERNHVTIDLLKKAGVKVITTPSSELSRGRGGPRCMTMPLERDDI